MRISDWSSDMCSSDLVRILPDRMLGRARPAPIVGRAGWLVGRACAAHDKDGKRGLPRRRAQVRDQREIAAFVLRLIGNRDRKSVVMGKRVGVRVDIGGRRSVKKKINNK